MKEIRGLEAIRFADTMGLSVSVDYNFLAQRETEIQGRPVSPDDIDSIIEDAIGLHEVEHGEAVVPGTPAHEFLKERHGDQWMLLPLEGNHPEREEDEVLQSFEAFARATNLTGGDALLIHDQYPPDFKDSGFAENASADLFFQTALRLSQKGKLRAVPHSQYYGNMAFYLVPQ